MENDVPKPYVPPQGLHFRRFYPVEGDSAIAEICWNEDQVAELSLGGVRLHETGTDRTTGAHVELVIYPRTQGEWTFRLDDFLSTLEEARTWLLQNEEGRTPLDEDGPMTAAGSAFDKISGSDPLWRETGP